jgi:plastocyanin
MREEFGVTLDKEGAYVYKCSPHIGLGMLGAIVVGEGQPENIDQI